MEKWEKIKEDNIIDDYIISNKGNVLRLSTNHYIKVKNNSTNYVQVNLKCNKDFNKKQKSFLLHRLVAKYFIPNPNNYPVVAHIDSNIQNNAVSNLRWCTISQNNHFRLEKEKKLKIKHTGKRLLFKEKNWKDLLNKNK